MSELYETEDKELTRAAMIAVIDDYTSDTEAEASFDELERLLDTAGAQGVIRLLQRREHPDKSTYLGTGKCDELKKLCEENDVSLIVADSELSPIQIKNLEDETDVRVIDRSMLILDIFALNAGSAEGKLQVEIAQMRYTIPRLIGRGTQLSRLGGGIGTRGPGESKLESDKRHLHRRIEALEEKLAELENTRKTQRQSRERSGLFTIAVAGYTNAGKSTLLNLLTGAGVLAQDKLFATLDPTTRKLTLPSGREILITDTVGFIRNLPHHLIKAFSSTLDEVRYADAVLVVVDASDPHACDQLGVTRDILAQLGCADTEVMLVYNKCDLLDEIPADTDDTVYISARESIGIDSLVSHIEKLASKGMYHVKYLLPMSEGGRLAYLYESSAVESVEYTDAGTLVTALVDEKTRGMMRRWET